jgi:phage terminase large subunit-like protein
VSDLAELIGALGPAILAENNELNQWPIFNKLYGLYPDEGPLRRELYGKHLKHFAAGLRHNERALVGGNRSGKTLACSYEHTLHLIGWYPAWWDGFRFSRPIVGWAAGEDTKAVRESLQTTFLGPPGALGSGLIPRDRIERVVARGGVPDAVDAVQVRHSSGATSRLVFKSYEMGRENFQAAKVDVMQFDEEPPQAIYTEGMTRTMSTVPDEPNGLVICGFTPLRGLSGVVLSFMPGGDPKEGTVVVA